MNNYLYKNIHLNSDKSISLTVSADQPYLKDHDVGMPLFGTVLSLEAMAEARSVTDTSSICCIKNVVSGKDCLFAPGSDNELVCTAEDDHLAVYSKDSLIFRCIMSAHTDAKADNAADFDISALNCAKGAISSDIYGSLFHGPAFQVLKKAVVSADQAIISEMNSTLPPLSYNTDYRTVLPVRIIEFCLQSCGMWELAYSDCVSVPLSIRQINIFTDRFDFPIYAVTHMTPDGGHIQAVNKAGNVLLEVIGYRTKEMPYEGGNYSSLRKKLIG